MKTQSGKDRPVYQPTEELMEVWPGVSGNPVNGLGEAEHSPPRPVFWRTDESIRHTDVLFYFYDRYKDNERIKKTREYRQKNAAMEVSEIAAEAADAPTEGWTEAVKNAALECGADEAGICEYRPEWTYVDRPQPNGKWCIVMGFEHDFEELATAPDESAYIEVMNQYGRAGGAAKKLANWIRERGYPAEAKTGPMTEDVLMIPAAIEAGLGELGKHGSMINKRMGSNFRLSMVLTDLPVSPDRPEIFGADAFCQNCQVCMNACPPDAIYAEKQILRGELKWYVDFDKCIQYFVDNETCGICLAVCPWSRPGVAENLTLKMARRMQRAED